MSDSISHINSKLLEEQEKAENEKAGMNVGTIYMRMYLKGRPYTNFENDIILHKTNGSIVGERNHSRKFPAAFRPFVSSAVTKRVKNFISTKLTQTGHLSALNISADKATYKHNTRQFLACVTSFPEQMNLFELLVLDIAKNFKEELYRFNFQPCQIEGESFDGQYIHFNIFTHH